MQNTAFVDWVFVVILGVIGLALIVTAKRASQVLPEECKDMFIVNALTSVMFLGAVMLTVTISFMLCNLRLECYDSKAENKPGDNVGSRTSFYLGFGIVMSLLCMGLAIGLAVQLKDSVCSVGEIYFYVYGIITLSAIVMISSVIGLIVVKKASSKPEGNVQEKPQVSENPQLTVSSDTKRLLKLNHPVKKGRKLKHD